MEITLFTKCLFEFIGTLVLVLLGDGVVASTVLKQSKGFNGGWAVITIAWGLAVMCGVLIAGPYSGAHLNPAVSVGLAVAGSFPWAFVPGYIAAQLLGRDPQKAPGSHDREPGALLCLSGKKIMPDPTVPPGLPAPPQWRCHPGRPRCRRFPSGPAVP